MIRHIPEGVFPFDDCGYARTPLIPFAEQAIALDCLPNMNLWLRTGLGAVGCCLAFDFFGDCLRRKLLKLGFLALCVIMDGYWTVTVMMMITFENITWEERLK